MTEKYKNIKHPIRNEWAWSLMKDVVYISSGNTPKGINDVKLKPQSNIDFYKIFDMNTEGNEKYMKDSALKVTLSEASSLKLKLEEPNTIIFPKRGGAILTNKKRILSKKSAYDLNLMGVKEKSEIIENRFLWFWFQKLDLSRLYDGYSVPQINNKNIEPLWFPVAPLPEQRVIVSKIEQLFSDLDNGIDNFKKAQEQLKRYRQSVLKAACEGKLVPTEAELARVEGRDYEPADVLLARILEERREKWNGKGEYKEPAVPDTNRLPELPRGWCLANVGQMTDSMKNGIYKPKEFYAADGFACLRMYNIDQGKIVWKDIKRMNLTKEEIDEYLLVPGDLLVNRVNSRELVGKAAVISSGIEKCIFESKNIRVRVLNEVVNPYYLCYHFTLAGTKYFNRNAQQVVGMASISQPQIARFPVPLPPLSEQHRIVVEVKRRLSLCDKMEATIAESMQKAESLRKSILKKAFEGKLLSETELEEARNTPDWEPAEKLLERIKAEKTNIKTKDKGKK